MKYILETERLRLREITLDHSRSIIKLLNILGWYKGVDVQNVKTKEQAVNCLKNGPLKCYIQDGFGLWLVETKTKGKTIGVCGITKEILQNPEIRFAFLPDYHGKGYGVELASAILRYAKEELGLPKVYAMTIAGNIRSTRLLRKIGLRFEKIFTVPNCNTDMLLYSN